MQAQWKLQHHQQFVENKTSFFADIVHIINQKLNTLE